MEPELRLCLRDSVCPHAAIHPFLPLTRVRLGTRSTSRPELLFPGGPSSTSQCVIFILPRRAMTNFSQAADNFNATIAMNAGRDPEAVGRVPITLFLSTSSLSPPSTLSLSPLIVSTADVPEPSSTFDPQPTNEGSGFGMQASDRNDVPSIIAGQCASCSLRPFLEIDHSYFRCPWWSCWLVHPHVIGLVHRPS